MTFGLFLTSSLPHSITFSLPHFLPFSGNKKLTIFAPQKGLMAEWLGAGLQNRIQRFESA